LKIFLVSDLAAGDVTDDGAVLEDEDAVTDRE
jgi:hypothetical protein